MPAIMLHLQKKFKLTIIDELPQAVVEMAADGDWVRCCPLCGCIHKVQDVDKTLPYTPLCQKIPSMFKAQQDTWRKLYPTIVKYTTLRLVAAGK